MEPTARIETLTQPLSGWIEGFLQDVELSGHSPETLRIYRLGLEHFAWWCRETGIAGLDGLEPGAARRYAQYLRTGKQRWGDETWRTREPLSPASVQHYTRILKIFGSWLVREEVFERTPLARLQVPRGRVEQPTPLTDDELRALLAVCRADTHVAGARDEALILVLLDTGLRVSEVVTMPSMLSPTGSLTLTGKGNKQRTIHLGQRARRAVLRYLRRRGQKNQVMLWLGKQGPLKPVGVRRVLQSRSEQAGVRHVHPHLLRHTFAVSYLRNGGDTLSLMKLLGHTSLIQTAKYVKLTEVDLASKHRRHSPADLLGE